MFPEAFAEEWITRLTRPGDLVLDPFCGRGTTPFSAVLLGRRAVATDVNHVAYCITKAKTQAPSLSSVRRRVSLLEKSYRSRTWLRHVAKMPDFFAAAYHRDTLAVLLYLRQELHWRTSRVDAMIAALVLGSLHGECDKSASYFSNQMPRTISTKPAYSVRFWEERGLLPPERCVFSILRQRLTFRYETAPAEGTCDVYNTDMRLLPRLVQERSVDCVITSPPYLDVTNFEEDQWLRLWFLGGPDVPTRNRLSRDDRHTWSERYWRFIGDMWRTLGQVVSKRGDVVVRIGCRRVAPEELASTLVGSSVFSGRRIELVETRQSDLGRRQTDAFRPGSLGCLVEVDCHFAFLN